ncbi:uncharacterized protein At2g02148 isoform X6 [Malania oleifera]|uniref:uncharacterized protein At2g02148 isoform X6 n=1 Tax=Malania oleifera TaxID=397392 RepID=UPI0025AEA99E|nr:uncharacterized protein At2g02148 isoform X6 [Malania oleifera]
MGTRVPVQHYNLRSANSFIGSSLHDLNTVDARPGEIEGISDVDRDGVTEDSLDNDEESNSVDCMHESYRNSLPLDSVGVEEDRSSLENSESSRGPYDMLTFDDVTPIETARARFLQIIVDHFINEHVVEVADSEANYAAQSDQDKLSKRKTREIQYEGDPRLASMNGMHVKTIGVALEAAGGLYRRLAKKFPRKGTCTFKRRELATSCETRTRFPELVIQEEKRVRFVVVNGLDIIEKPNNMPIDDAEWFKRLTGRNVVAVSTRDYKFYSPRHKYRRIASNSSSNIPGLPPQNQQQTPSKHQMQTLSHQPQFHPIQQGHHQTIHQSQHAAHFSQNHQCGPSAHLTEITHAHQSPTISQHLDCLQPLAGVHGGGRLHVMQTGLAKFCDECGAPYLRESSKFCSECGFKRLGT